MAGIVFVVGAPGHLGVMVILPISYLTILKSAGWHGTNSYISYGRGSSFRVSSCIR